MLLRCLALNGLFLFAALQLNAALQIATNFESASARILALDSQTQEIRISPGGDPKRGMPNWWYLRIDGIDTNKPLAIEVVAVEDQVPGSDNPAQPLSFAWTLPERAAISTDGISWQQTAPGQRDGQRSVYRVNATSTNVWLAWGPPFTPRDSVAFAERIARDHSFAKAFTLAQSREGRAVAALQISEGSRPATNRPAIWINARQHAWECGGTWVAAGFTDWLVSNDERAKWLRQNAEIFVVPVMDVDHVATGDGGKLALPQDHIRDWSDSPHWPEVAAAEQRIFALGKQGRMAVYLDLHNGSSGQRLESFYLPYPPYVTEETMQIQNRFFDCARAAFGEIKLMDGKPGSPDELPIWKNNASPSVRSHCGPHTIAFTVETPWNVPQGTPEGFREVGRKLGLAVEQYVHDENFRF